MTDHRDTVEHITAEIAQERRRQVTRLGYTTERDRAKGVGTIIHYAIDHLPPVLGNTTEELRTEVIQAAAILVAAVEVLDAQIANKADAEMGVDLGRNDPLTGLPVGYCRNCAHAVDLHRHRTGDGQEPVLGKCIAFGCSCPSPLT